MSELINREITALSLAEGIEKIYQDFTDSVVALGGKKKGNKMAGSLVHWLAGSHVRTERDILCDKFLADVQSYLETFDYALEGLDEESARQACAKLIFNCTQPVKADSNGTSSLMKRAMIGQTTKYLSRLSREQLLETKERISSAYLKWQQLPVETNYLKEINRLLK